MERRKFVIGAGALATGSAAAMGTGAFSNATVEREVTVETTGDSAAYVGFEPTSDYASFDGNTLKISFDQLNEDADFSFEDTFKVTNNGSETLSVDRINEDGWSYDNPESPFKIFVSEEVNKTQEEAGRFIWDDRSDAAELDPADTLYFGFGFFDDDEVADWDPNDAPETLTLNLS